MEDEHSGSDGEYIEYSDEGAAEDTPVRGAYNRAPTPYEEEELPVVRVSHRGGAIQLTHEKERKITPNVHHHKYISFRNTTRKEESNENWCNRALREFNARQARHKALDDVKYGMYHKASALNAIPTENPQETKAWLEKILKGYQDQGTQTDSVTLQPRFKKDCENALVAINNILKTEDDWSHEWIQEWTQDNRATLEQIQKANGDQKGLDEPDFD
jgi:hypothetical protein